MRLMIYKKELNGLVLVVKYEQNRFLLENSTVYPTSIEQVRQMQRREGNEPCFKTRILFCPYKDRCRWASKCLDNCATACHIFKVVENGNGY